MKKKKLKKKYDYAVKVNKHLLTELEEANRHMKSQDHEIESLMSGITTRDQFINKLKFGIYHNMPKSTVMGFIGNDNNYKLSDATLTPECRETRKG